MNTNQLFITEEMVDRFYYLSKQSKKIEAELDELKKVFIDYFDNTVGKNVKGESQFGKYKLQRQIRNYESYDDEAAVHKLEALNLVDCIKQVKQPDKEKIKAAETLGLISSNVLEDCITRKVSHVITVKETS